MRRFVFFVCALFIAGTACAGNKEYIWPKGKMPDRQAHQIAAMTNVTKAYGFKAEEWTEPYLEWFEKPKKAVDNDACMILISGGSYKSCPGSLQHHPRG